MVTVRLLRSIPTHVGFTEDLLNILTTASVHPHARGVYVVNTMHGAEDYGPSPRTWGLQPLPLLTSSVQPVHPHARGVYRSPPALVAALFGPSPRTWGLQSCLLSQNCSNAVHPHARGVYWSNSSVMTSNSWSIPTHVGFTSAGCWSQSYASGPSPRTWGLLPGKAGCGLIRRSIPTHVGFTSFVIPPLRRSAGPSPRTWGLRPTLTRCA